MEETTVIFFLLREIVRYLNLRNVGSVHLEKLPGQHILTEERVWC